MFQAVGFIFTFYLFVYAVNSLYGGYRFLPSGNWRPVVFSSPDTYFWQPRYGLFHPHRDISGDLSSRFDLVGLVFAPLILLDQKFVHQTVPVYTHEHELIPGFKELKQTELHPLVQFVGELDDEMFPQLTKARTENNKPRYAKLRKIRSQIIWLRGQTDDYEAITFGSVALALFLLVGLVLGKVFPSALKNNSIVQPVVVNQ